MAIQVDRRNGQNYSENISDRQLYFNEGSWNVSSGSGQAYLSNEYVFSGEKSLRLENLSDSLSMTAGNASQSTSIGSSDDYQISWYCLKNFSLEEITGSVLIYKNSVLLDTQTFIIGSSDSELDINAQWVRYQSDQTYNLLENDNLTFEFSIVSSLSGIKNIVLFFDGFMISKQSRLNTIVPQYNNGIFDLYNRFTGWGNYSDTQYTSASPLVLSNGVKIDLPNNAGNTYDLQKPIDVESFYDGTIITGRKGDGICVTYEFKCRPMGAGANPRVTISVDIGGSIGELYPIDFFLTKGNGVEHNFVKAFDGYTLDTWQSNGGTVKAIASNEDIEIYDIRYVITRTHKAR